MLAPVFIMSPLQKEYHKLKSDYPDAVIWFSILGFIECFSECAVKTSDTLKLPLTNRPDNDLLLCGFSESNLNENLQKMIKSGFKVALVESSYNNKKTNVKRSTP
jgi:DNA mismatch repair protein MutS